MSAAKQGDTVQVHYTGRLGDDSVFDSSDGREPLKFTIGGGEVIPGVSQAVEGMELGDKKTVEISPEQAYGPHQPEMAQKVARDQIPPEVTVGTPLRAEVNGQEVILWVAELEEEFAVVDANHPLAGKTLIFDLELVAVEEG